MDLVLTVRPLVPMRLSGVIDPNHLLALAKVLKVAVGGGDSDAGASATGSAMNFHGGEGAPGGADDLENDFPLPGFSLHYG